MIVNPRNKMARSRRVYLSTRGRPAALSRLGAHMEIGTEESSSWSFSRSPMDGEDRMLHALEYIAQAMSILMSERVAQHGVGRGGLGS